MQQVPNPGDCASSESASSHGPRWSRTPRVQLLRNRNDQRVPFYIDQTVPVWPLQQAVRRSHSSTTSPSARSPIHTSDGSHRQGNQSSSQHRGYGVARPATKFTGASHTAWFRSLKGALRTFNVDAHACNVSEILRDCSSCDATTSANSASSKWSGIEQDLFTCTSVDPKVFVVPSAADFISDEKSKGKSVSD